MILQNMHVEAIAVLVDGNDGWLNGSLDQGSSEVKRMTQGEASGRGGVDLHMECGGYVAVCSTASLMYLVTRGHPFEYACQLT